MKSYAPALFLDRTGCDHTGFVDSFLAWGVGAVEQAGDELKVEAVWHPLARLAIATRLLEQATAELKLLGFDPIPTVPE